MSQSGGLVGHGEIDFRGGSNYRSICLRKILF